jgi:hypothetical protein
MQIGKLGIVTYADGVDGTSNATGFTITSFPFTSVRRIDFALMGARNGGTIINTAMGEVSAGTATVVCYIDHIGNAWTNSSTKGAGQWTAFVELA